MTVGNAVAFADDVQGKSGTTESETSKPAIAAPANVDEARDRSKLVHEIFRGTLQVVHRDLFDEDNGFAIPSRSLEDVFSELARSYDVDLKWLIVNADVLNIDHVAETDFEKQAVKVLAKGQPALEQVTENRFHYAGAITLHSQCLKCHVKRRTSNENRTAGLLISMPIAPDSSAP
ncbi:c-type heme family protein [Rubripirellula reticaptiva]|nr:DUF3365 domain-containing protein [Rubripirellula reticaptiva]